MLHILKSIYLISGFAFAFTFTLANGNENPGDKKARHEEVRVPVIDLAPWFEATANGSSTLELTEEQRDIVHQIRRACREVGFFQITGGLGGSKIDGENENEKKSNDEAMIQRTWKSSRDFFDLSIQEKLEHTTIDNTKYPYGYERSETLVRGKLLDGEDDGIGCDGDEPCTPPEATADLKETFALGPPDNNGSGMPPRRWIDSPNVSPDFQTSLEAYYTRMEDIALTLLQIFAIALEEPPDFFQNKMDHHMSALRLVHYYPLEKRPALTHNHNDNQTYKPSPEQREPVPRLVRAGAHTDYGALTILAAENEGLEVLLRDTAGGIGDGNGDSDGDETNFDNDNGKLQQYRWYPVPLISGAFVVNLGDLMQRWTNNEWISTMHRVVMPSTEILERRYSMAYFVNINGDTPIEPLKCCRGNDGDVGGDNHNNGRVITAGEHLMAKHLASMGIIVDDDDKAKNISSNMEKGSCNSSE